ncbi:MAG: hypothetical protein ACXQS8_07405, partial [Candidatus Helarchaeales archaeon]
DDSICLLDKKNHLIFTGDMIAWTPYIHTTIEDFRSSVLKILSHSNDIRVAIRGHGRPHAWKGFEEENYKQFLKDMDIAEKRILALLKQHGDLTAREMITSVFRRTHFVHQLAYRIFMRTQQFWIRKYLESLERKKLIVSYMRQGKRYYRIA